MTVPAPSVHGSLDDLSLAFEDATAEAILAWAIGRFGAGLVLACSFQDCVLVDLAVREDPDVEVLFIDTGFHFPETLEFVDVVRARYDLNLRVVGPRIEAACPPCGAEGCCEFRKVQPLNRALTGHDAWVTGLKRCDAPTRRNAPIVAFDDRRALVKVNPLATWSDTDIAAYIASRGLPEHPLVARGYLSIGCAPTTMPVDAGEHPRSGRWRGSGKSECGLHS